MYTETITRLLELAPSGLTNDQLLWRLRVSGLRLTSSDIGQTLAMLVDTGAASVSAAGRSRLAQFRMAPQKPGADHSGPRSTAPTLVLRAVTALVSPGAIGEPPVLAPSESDGENEPRADADWRRLLAYYAATQRLDPRGAVDERTDRHGLSWQLYRAEGRWWNAAELRFPIDALPSPLREALSRRPGNACSLGYPVSLFDEAGVSCFVPALLIPAAYRTEGPTLIVEITSPDPVLNPRWLEAASKRLSRWPKDRFVEALFPEGEVATFEDVTMRLANAAATLGGALVKPAQLQGELTIEGEGLRNVAGLFLPTDARFTQGAERDLDAMREWPDEALRETAVWPLLCAASASDGHVNGSPPSLNVPPVGPRPLTDCQYGAAVSALSGPLTLIQGPPGTGKSEVILALLTSIVLAGRSAVFVSRNHRALDEVEERLARVAGDIPLLTRAGDSDGQRDTDFVSEMRLLATGDMRPGGAEDEDGSKGMLEDAQRLLGMWRHRRRETDLNLALSEAVERLDRWNEAASAVAAMPAVRRGLFRRLLSMLRHRRADRDSGHSSPGAARSASADWSSPSWGAPHA